MKQKILVIALFSGLLCSAVCGHLLKEERYWLLYPLETTKQETTLYEGMRFLTFKDGTEALIAVVLNNPIRDGGYADMALFGSVPPLVRQVRTRTGELTFLKGDALVKDMRSGRLFDTPKIDKDLVPRMQAHGCAPNNTKETRSFDEMETLQKELIRLRRAYVEKKYDIILAEAAKGRIIRILIPPHKEDTPLVVMTEHSGDKRTLRFQFQHLN